MLPELYEAHAEDEPVTGQVDDPITARLLLIEYQRNERKLDGLRHTAAAVAQTYDERMGAIHERQEQVREMLLRFCAENGRQSFPDVGSCHVVQRKPTARITDTERFAGWALGEGRNDLVRVEQVVKLEADARKLAAAAFTEGGELLPGCEPVVPEPSLTIKAAG
jgi:hypothetical protein